MGLAWGIVTAFGLATASGGEAAARPKVTLSVSAPADLACPDPIILTTGIVERLGYDPFVPESRVQLRLTFERHGQGHVARLERKAPDAPVAVRELSSTTGTCADLRDAVALAASIVIDPEAYLSPPPPAPVVVALSPPPAAPASPPPGPPLTLRLGVGGGAHLGASPQAVSPAAVVHAGLGRTGWALGAEVRVDARGSRAVGAGKVHARYVLGSLVPCFEVGLASVCGVASAGAIRAGATGLERPRNVSAFLALAGARTGLSMRLTRSWELWSYLEAQAVLTRATVRVDERPTWVTPAVTGGVGTQLRMRFE